MDYSALSLRSINRSIKKQRLGVQHAIGIWLYAWSDGPRHKKGSLPPEIVEPGVERIQQWVEKGNQTLASMALHYQHSIPAERRQVELELALPQREFLKRQAALDDAIERYKADHDGMEPPEQGAYFTQLVSFWFLAGVFSLAELPLMYAALERLPIPDWTRSVSAFGASALVIFMAHEIGIWCAKPAKTLIQAIVGWLMIALLCVILTFAALVRRDAIQDRQNSPLSPTPEVYFKQGVENFYV